MSGDDVLARIEVSKRAELAAAMARRPLAAVEAAAAQASPPRGFAAALTRANAAGRVALIAEIKRASPSKGLIRADFDPPTLARAYAAGGADCLSVLTDAPFFQGSDAFLEAARAACDLPCLRKDFLYEPYQVVEARALGADAVLVILAAVDDAAAAGLLAEAARLGMDALVEVHDAAEMARAAALGAALVGVNTRDLRSFRTDLGVFNALAPLAPRDALLVGESAIAGPADVARLARAGAGAVLVGEALMRQPDVAEAARALMLGARLGGQSEAPPRGDAA